MTSLLLLVALQGKTEFKPRRVKPAPVANAAAPVTREEARATFVRLAAVADRAIGGKRPAYACGVPASSGAIPASETVAEFARLTDRYAGAFRLVPIAATGLKGAARAKALRMWSANGPVALGRPTLTVREFGDAAGYFLVRLGDLTHTPSHRFSPATMPDGL